MILIEGPDNSGKSTLVEQLTVEFNLFKCDRPHGPPKTPEELYNRTMDVQNFYKSRMFIMDRNPIIGENIYGPILRNQNMWDLIPEEDKLDCEANFFSKIIGHTIFLIYCRPPREVLLDLSTHQVKDYDTKEHLESLSKNKSRIVDAYDRFMSEWATYTYNYKDPLSLDNLKETLRKEYLNEC